MAATIPPTPVGGQFGSYEWQDWYEQVRRAINGASSISWSQITDFIGGGILPVTKGGSGTATPALVAGTGITITGAWPNHTIAATAGTFVLLAGDTMTGSLTAPSFIPNSNTVPTNGLYRAAVNTLGFATNSAERFRVSATGEVLIGDASANLSNAGRGLIEVSGTSDAAITLKKTNVTQGYLYGDGALGLSVNGVSTLNLQTGSSTRLQITSAGVIQDAAGLELGFKGLPSASVTTGAFVASDNGKIVNATAGVTVPNAVMAAGNVVWVYNNTAAAITLTATITTLRLAGTATTGNRTIAARGMCMIYFLSSTEAITSGTGVT